MTKGTVIYSKKTTGYGGLILLKHNLENRSIISLYGHLNLSSSTIKNGDIVEKGQFLAHLGEDKSIDTDGERKHLHFALYEGKEVRLQGYEKTADRLSTWINPLAFFQKNQLIRLKKNRLFEPKKDIGGENFSILFEIPDNHEIEYIPSLKALNIFLLAGEGTARERSKVLIRFFDAVDFLTLSTVTIHSKIDLKIGKEAYRARRYDIEKKPGVADFPDQPAWRNKRHIVTDFTDKNGLSRYYVVASNPDFDLHEYEKMLASIEVIK